MWNDLENIAFLTEILKKEKKKKGNIAWAWEKNSENRKWWQRQGRNEITKFAFTAVGNKGLVAWGLWTLTFFGYHSHCFEGSEFQRHVFIKQKQKTFLNWSLIRCILEILNICPQWILKFRPYEKTEAKILWHSSLTSSKSHGFCFGSRLWNSSIY